MVKMVDRVYEIHDSRFRNLIVQSAELEELYTGCRWAEGPVWFADMNCLLFSDIPNQRMLRYIPGEGVSIYREPSNFVNGNTRDRQGRLVS
ncbi:MAG: SMP-30/gluconolactonase/LRE family protein, partial [Rhizobiaceae bacterium]|nr:SMP-30/gluconolactonase/LRE family protein [Rhizobiaceae bacterium]